MMELTKPEQTAVNDSGTGAASDTSLTQPGSRDVLGQTRRELIVMRNKHGATRAIGLRCSNLIELIQVPELPKGMLERQMADLQRLLVSPQ